MEEVPSLDCGSASWEELACSLFAVVLGSAPGAIPSCPLSLLALSEISSKESDFLGARTAFTACIPLLDI